ncbi:glucosyltransferase [Coniothyrium glycines]
MLSPLRDWTLHFAFVGIVQLTLTWVNLVSKEVPEPYLDEFFHVPQAQKYCIDDYSWDPKITTPPGLYIVSKVLRPLLGCDTSALRFLNTVASWLIVPLCYGILRRIHSHKDESQHGDKTETSPNDLTLGRNLRRQLDAHSAANIALFPPLISFSALYYTDLISTLLVLLSYFVYLSKDSTHGSFGWNVQTISIGIAALFFRQTNIFWVAIFPAGLALVDALKQTAGPLATSPADVSLAAFRNSWSGGMVYDCSLQNAAPQDYVLFFLSLSLAALKRPILVLKAVLPYLVLLVLFAGFVAWNGSVVLGDRSAHTATIHVPQMLYIWPYIAFFSLPLLLGPLLKPVLHVLPRQIQSMYHSNTPRSHRFALLDLVVPAGFLVGGLAAVHYNTIIHPYTLADNRHYVFYIFRIIRRHSLTRYLAVPIYATTAWLAMRALHAPDTDTAATAAQPEHLPRQETHSRSACRVSFVVVWLGATALSVVSAPLVEPRYFILPWIMWRLHLPHAPCTPRPRRSSSNDNDNNSSKPAYDLRLFLETLWLLGIDAVLGYVFLYRTFTWANEPGKLQRFIW